MYEYVISWKETVVTQTRRPLGLKAGGDPKTRNGGTAERRKRPHTLKRGTAENTPKY